MVTASIAGVVIAGEDGGRQYGPSHGTGLADALIASTVAAVGATLATLNRRHFPMLNDVLVPYVKPQQ